jgi:hypothetical protein
MINFKTDLHNRLDLPDYANEIKDTVDRFLLNNFNINNNMSTFESKKALLVSQMGDHELYHHVDNNDSHLLKIKGKHSTVEIDTSARKQLSTQISFDEDSINITNSQREILTDSILNIPFVKKISDMSHNNDHVENNRQHVDTQSIPKLTKRKLGQYNK